MTRIAETPEREPLEATPRKRLTALERITILTRQHDRCAGCGESLIWTEVEGRPVYGPMIDEHILPLELGGSNDLINRELRCVSCAKAETREDRKRIDKARRLRAKQKPRSEWPRTSAPIRSRGFRSRWEGV